MVNIDTKVVS